MLIIFQFFTFNFSLSKIGTKVHIIILNNEETEIIFQFFTFNFSLFLSFSYLCSQK